MKYDTEKIRLANPLKEWLERYGIEINRKGFAKCRFHSEKTASFRVCRWIIHTIALAAALTVM